VSARAPTPTTHLTKRRRQQRFTSRQRPAEEISQRPFPQDPTARQAPHPPPAPVPPPHSRRKRCVLDEEMMTTRPTSRCSTLELHPRDMRPWHGPGRPLPKEDRQMLLRKEVIQPHLPVRLPCYDFVPIASPTFDGSLPQGVGPPASGVTNFRDVTGGVYKPRERIHRSVADLRLLATPTSRGRVADPDPN
jgi:hypothetical protein